MTRDECEDILRRTAPDFMREQAALIPGHKPIHILRVLRQKALIDLREALAFMLADSMQTVASACGER